MDKVYTTKEAGALLNLHRNSVINMINDGRIKAEKIGNKWGITKEEIERVQKEGC